MAVVLSSVGSIQGAGAPNYLAGAGQVIKRGNYAYVISFTDNSLSIFNISNPAAPSFAGKILNGAPPALLQCYAMALVGNYIIVPAINQARLTVIDVSNPAAPAYAGQSAVVVSPFRIIIQGKYAFVSSKSGFEDFTIWDISALPVITLVKDGIGTGDKPEDLFIQGNFLYEACFTTNSLKIWNIKNLANPVLVGSISGAGAPNHLQGASALLVDGNYAYVTGWSEASLVIVDISNPTNPTLASALIGTVPFPLSSGNWLYKVGNYVFVGAVGSDSVTVVNVSNPAAPVGETILQGAGAPKWMGGANSIFIPSSAYAYVSANHDQALNVVGITGLQNTPEVTTGFAENIATASVTLHGYLQYTGNSNVTEIGICYGTSLNPDIAGTHVASSMGSPFLVGPFTSGGSEGDGIPNIIGLTPGAAYHFRAYATNGSGTVYGADITFSTLSVPAYGAKSHWRH